MKSHIPERGLRLYPVAIQGAGTCHVESMTSFICAAAVDHRRSPKNFIEIVNRYAGCGLRSVSNFCEADGCTINGYGLTQKRVLSGLTRAFDRGDLAQMCLGQFGVVFAPKGGRVVKTTRHWCPICYHRQRQEELRAYDLLLWQIADLHACPVCHVRLTNACGQCGSKQQTIPVTGTLDHCIKCRGRLGSDSYDPPAFPSQDLAYQAWLIPQLEQLLIAREELSPILTGFEPARFLQSVLEARQLTLEDLSKQIHMPMDTLRQWARNRCKPTFTSGFVLAQISAFHRQTRCSILCLLLTS